MHQSISIPSHIYMETINLMFENSSQIIAFDKPLSRQQNPKNNSAKHPKSVTFPTKSLSFERQKCTRGLKENDLMRSEVIQAIIAEQLFLLET